MAIPASRSQLIDYCKRNLGAPVLEINVDSDQIDDRIDEGLQYFQEFHSDAVVRSYLQHEITDSDVSNQYIPISDDVLFVSKMFPVKGGSITRDFFDIKYQLHLNDISNLQSYMGDIAYYEQIQQYLSLIDMKLNGMPQVDYSRYQDRLYIRGDFQDGDLQTGDYIVVETYNKIDPDAYTEVWNDKWLKEYCTALIKRQWGTNLMKFEGLQLPGGVTFNGRQMFDDATTDIQRLQEQLRSEHELPIDFMVG